MNRSAPGRPRLQETADDIVASVLATAGSRISSSDYSTRRIAALTGLSQSLVSRAVRRIRLPEPVTPGNQEHTVVQTESEPPILQLNEMQVSYPRITLTFALARNTSPTLSSRAAQRRGAAIMAALWVSEAASWAPPTEPGTSSIKSSAQQQTPTAISSDPDPLTVTWEPGHQPWPSFLGRVAELLDACAHTTDALPPELLQMVAERSGQGLHGVIYQRGTTEQTAKSDPVFDSRRLTVAEFPAPGRSSVNRWLPAVQLSATEQIAVALRKEMMISKVGPGDRISPAAFAERLRLSTATVRTAMRQLADDGLLIRAHGGFRIPSVTGADVIDLYAARLHMGMVLLPAACTQPRHRLLAARLALGTLEATAAEGTRADVGEADLRFQQELVEAAGLVQSTRSFHWLTLRVRMFISVLQLDYTPAVDRLLHDDRRLLTAVLENRPEDAVRIWRSKLDHAVRHMSALAPESFDAALWDRLTRQR